MFPRRGYPAKKTALKSRSPVIRNTFTRKFFYSTLSTPLDTFPKRHLGSSEGKIKALLSHFNLSTLEEFTEKVIPSSIRRNEPFTLPGDDIEVGESGALLELQTIMNQNQIYRSYLGMGFHNTITPSILLRNMFENPLWYTPYTPYQSEISQGRMESLLNFQTMITELTGMGAANASLLDEATACSEAMIFAYKNSTNNSKYFFIDQNCHPQNIEVTRVRAEPLGVEIIVGDANTFDFSSQTFCGGMVQYPATDGQINTYSNFVEHMHKQKGFAVFSTDILALTLVTPPGELGADVVVGNSQRFGVPLGYGGPHAAFLAIKDAKMVRKLPGRVVGVSIDQQGNSAYRLSMQTREQHIRREKATSNICTAQALLANVAAMYAVYHGPQGLKDIAERVHLLTVTLADGLKLLGHQVLTTSFFDTITVKHSSLSADSVIQKADELYKINLRKLGEDKVGIAFDETTKLNDLVDLFNVFSDTEHNFRDSTSPFNIDLLSSSAQSVVKGTPLERTSPFLTHPVFNRYHQEHEMLRYLNKLVRKDLSLAISMISLGSCTMKLNATSEMIPVTWPTVNQLHPFVPKRQALGYDRLFSDLETMICNITGFKGVSFQPNAGSAGEYTGLRVIRAYHQHNGQAHRNVVLIPTSAHGTNPASAAMAGFKIVTVDCLPSGYIDMNSLRTKAEAHRDNLAAIMVTYPSTYGVFEEAIKEVCDYIHSLGAQVYLDGANMNALVGLVSLSEIGADVCHLNLHKTFCIPHGGGGPGMGPIAVQPHLVPFLPSHPGADYKYEHAMGPVSAAPWGSSSILPITWMYIRMMGSKGLRQATQLAILNANYIRSRLADHYLVKFTASTGFCAHEVIIDIRPLKEAVEAEDVAKRLMDYNFHAPTMSWPVPGTLMIEPTESESKAELDRFCDALISIRREIQDVLDGKQPKTNNVLKNAPHTAEIVCNDKWDRPYSREVAAFPLPYVKENKFWPSVSRVNNTYGDTNIQCSCPPVSAYEDD